MFAIGGQGKRKYPVVQTSGLGLGTNQDQQKKQSKNGSHLIEILENGGELPTWRTPVCREVEADELLACQSLVGVNLGQVSTPLQSFAVN